MKQIAEMARDGALTLGALRVGLPGEGVLELEFPGAGVQVLDGQTLPRGLDPFEVLLDLIEGPERPTPLLWAEARWTAATRGPLRLRRDFETGEATLALEGETPVSFRGPAGESLFGAARATLRRQWIIDGREACAPSGGDALRGRLSALLGVVADPRAEIAGIEAELSTLEDRRRRLRREIEALTGPDEDSPTAEPVDPPALGELIEALEEARRVDRNMIGRRLELAETLRQRLAAPAEGDLLPVATLLADIEKHARDLEQRERALGRARRRARTGQGFALRALVLVGLLASGGLAAAGRHLDDLQLLQAGLAGAAGCLLTGFGAWCFALAASFASARRISRCIAERDRVRERALAVISRVGAPADLDDISAASLRRVVDRVSSRSALAEVRKLVAPFVDAPGDLAFLRQLESGLAHPLEEAARRGREAPRVPLVRATGAALALVEGWNRALDETAARTRAVCEERAQAEVERELLREALGKLEERIATLRARLQDLRARPAGPTLAAAAGRLRREVLPALREILGDAAPVAIDDGLGLRFDRSPAPTTASLVLLCARLLLGAEAGPRPLGLGRVVLDPGLALDAALEERLVRWLLARGPGLPLVLAFRRKRDLIALEESLQDAFLAHSARIASRFVENEPAATADGAEEDSAPTAPEIAGSASA